MPKFHVHMYPTLRVKFANIQAETQEEALEKAEALFWEEFNSAISRSRFDREDCTEAAEGELVTLENAEELTAALVDVVDDPKYAQSNFYHPVAGGWGLGSFPQVKISVSEGVANFTADPGVDVTLIDHDNQEIGGS